MARANEQLGTRLRRLRRERGLSQKELAGDAYTDSYVSQIESAQKHPSLDAIAFFAGRLEVDPDYLATGRHPQLEAKLALEIAEAKATVYAGEVESAITHLKELRDTAHREGIAGSSLMATESLALALERQGNIQEALEMYQEAESLAFELPLPTRAVAVAGIARCFQQLGDFRYSAHVLEQYLLQLEKEELRDPTALMRVYGSLIASYFALGLADKATEAAQEARRLEVRVSDPEQVACMNINVARALLYQGRTAAAIESLRKAEEIFASFGWKNEVARANIALGIVHIKEDDLATARGFFEEALTLLKEAPNPLDEARVLNELARVERLSGNGDIALRHAHRVLELVQQGDPRVRAFAHRELALSAATTVEAEKSFHQAIDLYRLAKDPAETANTFRALGDYYKDRGDVEAMADAYREGIEAVQERAY